MNIIRDISSFVNISSEVKDKHLWSKEITVDVRTGIDDLTESEFPEVKVAFWNKHDDAHIGFTLSLGETYALGNELLRAYLEGAAQASNAWKKVSMADHARQLINKQGEAA